MAFKGKETKTVQKKIVDQKYKILVAEGSAMFSPKVDYKVLHTEFKPNIEETKARIKDLELEFPNKSITYFSV